MGFDLRPVVGTREERSLWVSRAVMSDVRSALVAVGGATAGVADELVFNDGRFVSAERSALIAAALARYRADGEAIGFGELASFCDRRAGDSGFEVW
jgi:hypothetical protein